MAKRARIAFSVRRCVGGDTVFVNLVYGRSKCRRPFKSIAIGLSITTPGCYKCLGIGSVPSVRGFVASGSVKRFAKFAREDKFYRCPLCLFGMSGLERLYPSKVSGCRTGVKVAEGPRAGSLSE